MPNKPAPLVRTKAARLAAARQIAHTHDDIDANPDLVPKGYLQFRYPKAAHNGDKRIALQSGHVTIIGQDWKWLHPRFHAKARAAGCVAYGDQATDPSVKDGNAPGSIGAAQASREGRIAAALKEMLVREVKGDFTRDGSPNTNVVSALIQGNASKAEIMAVWATLKDEAGDDGEVVKAEDEQAEDEADPFDTDGLE